MDALIPADVMKFLKEGKHLLYDEEHSTVGRIRLVTTELLVVSEIEIEPDDELDPYAYLGGTYSVAGVNLVAESDEYLPEGILGWIPKYESFGTWDSEHGALLLFPGAKWKDIVKAPTKYLDEQWEPAGVGRSVPFPWLDLPFRIAASGEIIEPYPARCPAHRKPVMNAPQRSLPPSIAAVRDSIRLGRLDQYMNQVRTQFPCAGVPISATEERCCPDCREAESTWLQRAALSEPQVVHATDEGIVRCPACRIVFNINSQRSFLHGFHLTCGTRLTTSPRNHEPA